MANLLQPLRAVVLIIALSLRPAMGEESKNEAVFETHLATPGGEFAAVTIAKENPSHYLALLNRDPATTPALLVKGDLYWAEGKKSEALECYREAGRRLLTDAPRAVPGFPADFYYPVEPADALRVRSRWSEVTRPLQFGPGSHRDNWLIRRFIALEAWPEAAIEFDRVWRIHRGDGTRYSSHALQFALDYAFFLQERKQTDAALGILLEVLLVLDIDRPSSRSFFYAGNKGTSCREFVRLAQGAFKDARREDQLVEFLQKQIESGENRARRVLARVRSLQGNAADALELELKYIDASKFDDSSANFRRGLAYQEALDIEKATYYYEEVLKLVENGTQLPEPDEQAPQARLEFHPRPRTAKAEARMRLRTLYQGSGNVSRVFELVLADFDAFHLGSPSEHDLKDLENQFRIAGKESEFSNWAMIKAAAATSPRAKAEYYLAVSEYEEARKALVSGPKMQRSEIEYWEKRFAKAGEEERKSFQEAMLAADPENAYLQFVLKEGGSAAKQIAAMENMLNAIESSVQFSIHQDAEDPFTIAYRLMRLYEEQRDVAKMEKLALRIARLEKPFHNFNWEEYRYSDIVRAPEKANAALAIAIPWIRNKAGLSEALTGSPWIGARSQLERLMTGNLPSAFFPAGRDAWSNLPPDCELHVSDEDVLCLTRDERRVYSGHPWGISVWDFQGKLVKRVLLGEAARALAVAGGEVWAGTPKGLFRVSPAKEWAVAHQWLHEDLPAGRRAKTKPGSAYDYRSQNNVNTLCADGGLLWIGLDRNIQVLDIERNTLHIHTPSDWGISSSIDCMKIVATPKYVWAGGRSSVSRFERDTGKWRIVETPELRPNQLIGQIQGRLYANVFLNDTLRNRPCLIEPDTLELVPIPMEGTDKGRLVNQPFTFAGLHGDTIVMAANSEYYHLREKDGAMVATAVELRSEFPSPMAEPEELARLQKENPDLDRFHTLKVALAILRKTGGFPEEWHVLQLPGQAQVLARGHRDTRYEYHEDGRDEWAREIRRASGGLYFLFPDGRQLRASDPLQSCGLPGDRIMAVLGDKATLWICANGGLIFASPSGWRLFTRAEGLCSNRLTSAEMVNGTPFFATAWGDSGGGLLYWDDARRMFGTFFKEDGLDTNKIDLIQMDGNRLRISYGIEYMRHTTSDHRQFPDGWFDPAARVFQSGGERQIVSRSVPNPPPLPILGGYLLSKRTIAGKTYLCGSRGLLIQEGEATPDWQIASLNATLDNVELVRQNEARGKVFKYTNPADLIVALQDGNPYYRAKVLEAQWKMTPELLPIVAAQLDNPEQRVRCTAIVRLMKSKLADELLLPIYEKALADSNAQIRGIAALEMLERGRIPPLQIMWEFFGARQGELLYGMDSQMGAVANREAFYRASAACANRDIFGLLLNDPPHFGSYDYKDTVFPKLGASLTAHPEALDLLLRAYGENQTEFVAHVFRFSGAALLPRLYEALQSKERVVRSNAARACGAIGQAESVRPLLEALDLPSGLSQASIVWALGNLRAKEALPILKRLYVDTRNDDSRSAGFKHSQAVDTNRSQYSALQDLQSVEREWERLKPEEPARPLNPERDEELLRPDLILEAIAQIGPEDSQEFYRELAGGKNPTERRQAAIHLTSGTEDELVQNIPILRTLAGDAAAEVRISAAVSLLLLQDAAAADLVRNELKSGDDWIVRKSLAELERVKAVESLSALTEALRVTAENTALSPGSRDGAKRLLKRMENPPGSK